MLSSLDRLIEGVKAAVHRNMEDGGLIAPNLKKMVAVKETGKDIKRLRDVDWVVHHFSEIEHIERAGLAGIDMGQGIAEIDLYAPDELYDEVLKEIVGVEIRGKDHLLELMQDFAHAKAEYDRGHGCCRDESDPY